MKDFGKYLLMITGCTLWATLFFILPEYLGNPCNDFIGLCYILCYIAAVAVATFLLLYLSGLSKWIFTCFLPVFMAGGAIVSYYRVIFKSTVTPIIIDATLHTNAEEMAGVISWQLFVWIAINLLASILPVWLRWKKTKLTHTWAHALLAVLLLLGYYNVNNRLRNNIRYCYPYNIVYNLKLYKEFTKEITRERQIPETLCTSCPDSLNIIFVIGESLRADHMSLNGYERETTPRLAKRSNIISYPYIYSEHTHTTASVPHILTPADSLSPEKAYTHASFIRAFAQCDFFTAWIGNQDHGHTFVALIEESDTVISPNAGKYGFEYWLDEDLIDEVKSLTVQSQPKNLYVLHTVGSHWYYNLHVPETMQIFQPTTQSRVITENEPAQMINSYDNTVFYADYVIDKLISQFEQKNALLIFLSDHGESLGENGRWLHASGSPAEQNPACVIWYSNKYADAYPDKIASLQQNKTKRYRTDFLYYSILSAAGIEANGCNPAVNIFD